MSHIRVSGSQSNSCPQKLDWRLPSLLGSHPAGELSLRVGKMTISSIPFEEREDLNWRVLGEFGSAQWFEPTVPLGIWVQELELQYQGAPLVTAPSP